MTRIDTTHLEDKTSEDWKAWEALCAIRKFTVVLGKREEIRREVSPKGKIKEFTVYLVKRLRGTELVEEMVNTYDYYGAFKGEITI